MFKKLLCAFGCLIVALVAGYLYLHFFWSKDQPIRSVEFSQADFERLPALGLAVSAGGEYDHEAVVEGKIPKALRGVLYRNGPGLYERGKMRKRCLIDGDGMIQMFRIENGNVHYRNRFVRTEKFIAEEKADRFIYPTFTTQAPGGFLKNIGGGDIANQAGVSVVFRNERLYAFDDYQFPYELNPETLDTIGLSHLGMAPDFTMVSAHNKIDPLNSEWVFFGIKPGRKSLLHMTILDSGDRLKWHRAYVLPRYNYIHDFFMTTRYLLFAFHPATTNLLNLLSGRNSVTGALSWQPEKQNLLLLFERESAEEPTMMKTDASWMWHSINAYEADDKIIADYIGYDNPDHFIGGDPRLFAMMEGRLGTYLNRGRVKRMVIDPVEGIVEQHRTMADEMYAFPHINPLNTGKNYRYVYAMKMVLDHDLFDGIVRLDVHNGREDFYSFGSGVYTSEPVFAAKVPSASRGKPADESGWLLTQIYDSRRDKSGLAVFDSLDISSGPVAVAWLKHRMPMGFHGTWVPR